MVLKQYAFHCPRVKLHFYSLQDTLNRLGFELWVSSPTLLWLAVCIVTRSRVFDVKGAAGQLKLDPTSLKLPELNSCTEDYKKVVHTPQRSVGQRLLCGSALCGPPLSAPFLPFLLMAKESSLESLPSLVLTEFLHLSHIGFVRHGYGRVGVRCMN